jgi:hypothetical protein
MADFSVININPATNQTIAKYKFGSGEVFPEDTFLDIRNKIWITQEIPPYRQFLFTPEDFIPFDIFVNEIFVPVNIREWFSAFAEDDVVLSGIPINKYLTENKDAIKVNFGKQYHTIGNQSKLFLVDLNTLLTADIIREILDESYRAELIYYGFVTMFWPQLSYSDFQLYLKNSDEIMEVTIDEMTDILRAQQKIIRNIHASKSKSTAKQIGEGSVLGQLIQVDLGVRTINVRNIVDWFATSQSTPAMVAYIIDHMEGYLVVKKHTSFDDAISKFINRRGLTKVTKSTIPHVSFILRNDPEGLVAFTIRENGLNSEVYSEYLEEHHISLSGNFNQVVSLTKNIINRINQELQVAALPAGGRLSQITNDSIVSQQLTACTYWKKIISLKSFMTLRDRLQEYQDAGILVLKDEECSHNEFQTEHCFLIMFKKGMRSEEGCEVKIQLRSIDIRIEVIKAQDIQEFALIQKYLIYFFESQKLSTATPTDLAKFSLKTLQEKDPVLYNLRRYDPNHKVYSVLCQSSRQPILYTEEEYDNLPEAKKNSLIEYWNFTYRRPAYYECPNKKFPHLSFKIGKHPKNYCLPCCQKTQVKSEIDDQCFNEHVVVNTTSESSYVLTYGSSISIGRVSKVSRLLYEKLNEIHPCKDCDFVLYGVEQSVPGLNNCGVLMSIFTSFDDEHVDDFIIKLARKVMHYGSAYHLLGNGAAQAFDSPNHLADTIITLFVEKSNDFVVLESEEEWINIISSLIRELYNVELVIWDDTDESEKLIINTDFSFTDLTKILLVVKHKHGAYPVFLTDGEKTVYNSMLKNIDDNPVQALYDLINDLTSTVIHDQTVNQLCILELFFEKRKWEPVCILVDSRNLCYGIIAKKIDTNDHVHLPLAYSTTGKYLKNVEISHELKPKVAYRQDTLRDFVNEINSETQEAKACHANTITPRFILQNPDGDYIGFQAGKLFYFHDPEKKPINFDGINELNTKLMLYHPDEVDRALVNYSTTLTPSEKYNDIIRKEYQNHLYKLFLTEFVHFVRKERNADVRSKIKKLLSATDYGSASSLQKLFENIDKITFSAKKERLSYDDRTALKKIISDLRELIKIKIVLENTIFEFDQTILNELHAMDKEETSRRVKKIMSDFVQLVEIESINENTKANNIYLPCQLAHDEKSTLASHCKGKKLRMIKSQFEDYVKILSADIHNTTVFDITNVFDTSEFTQHPGEEITIIKK